MAGSMSRHEGVKDLDKRLTKASEHGKPKTWAAWKPEKGSIAERAKKARSAFRKAVRAYADKEIDFAATGRGKETFEIFEEGFNLARSLPTEVSLIYCVFIGSPGVPMFYKEESLKRLDHVIQDFEMKCAEILRLVEVSEVMES